MIYHMLTAATWNAQRSNQPYTCSSLETEGFIHCTAESERLLQVANAFYTKEAGEFLILCIDEAEVDAEIRWERADGHLFPHIYGPLNLDAILKILPFPRDYSGRFLPPVEWQHA